MGKSTISMAIFHSYFDITRGYGKYGARHLLGSQKWCRSIHLRSKTSLSTPELSVGAAQTFSGARNFREVGAQEVRCQQLCCLLAWQWSGTCNNQTSKSHIPMIDNWAFMMDILYVIFLMRVLYAICQHQWDVYQSTDRDLTNPRRGRQRHVLCWTWLSQRPDVMQQLVWSVFTWSVTV